MRRERAERKARWSCLLLLAMSAVAFSSPERPIRQGSLEILVGSYNIHEPRFDKVYPQGGLIGGLALSSALVSNFNFYLEIKHLSRTGTLTYTKEKTDLSLLPISLGLRYILPLAFVHPYLGGGIDFYFYYESNPIGTVLNYANGYHLLGGVYLQPAKKVPLMVNFRLKYTRAQAEEGNIQVELGGLEYGAGLSFNF